MDVNEMKAVVKHYINCRKEVEVDINVSSFRDIALLTNAYHIAIEWFKQNEYKITIK